MHAHPRPHVGPLAAAIAVLLVGALAAAGMGATPGAEGATPSFCFDPAQHLFFYEDGLAPAGGLVASNLVHTIVEPTVEAYVPVGAALLHQVNCDVVASTETVVEGLLATPAP